jgi:hypothetical protein
VIGQKPVIGRDFAAEDAAPGSNPVAILGYRVWEDRYGKDLGVLGQSVRSNSVPITTVGVMQNGLRENNVAQPWLNVVGVVPNIVQNLENANMRDHDPLIYVPYRQKPMRDMSIMARTLVSPNS